jgi:5-carboxyvanillate decarboxylase
MGNFVGSEAPISRIATEEAFLIPELTRAMDSVITSAGAYDPDIYFWQRAAQSAVLTRRLLDFDDERLRIMDECGVDMQLLSLAAPGVQMLNAADAVAIAKLANDTLAAAIQRHPQRYAGLATVAPQAPDEAAKELERAVTRLGLRGVLINSHTQGEYLDETRYWPILEAAAALDVPLYIHPRAPAPAMAAPYRAHTLEHAIWGFQAEAGLHGVRLLVSGILDRLPGLQIVLGHMGEGIPYWLSRIDTMHRQFQAPGRAKLQQQPSDYFKRNFVITTSGMNWNPALRFCLEVLGSDKILFAIDYPFQDTAEAVEAINEADLTQEQRAAILHGNAERVFRLGRPQP